MSDDGHVFGAMAFSDVGEVFLEGDVEHPVQAVFDAPVAAHGAGGGFGVEGRGGDVVAGIEAAAVLRFDLGAELDDRGHAGQAAFSGETALAVQ